MKTLLKVLGVLLVLLVAIAMLAISWPITLAALVMLPESERLAEAVKD